MCRISFRSRIFLILLVGVATPLGSLCAAKESAKPVSVSTKRVDSNIDESKPSLKKSKSASNLLISATKPLKTSKKKPLRDHERGKLDLVEKDESPNQNPAEPTERKLTIGATARVLETQSELPFLARVDTGAASCSIHCEEWEIDEESDSMEDNIGKPIRVLIANDGKESEWVDSRIEQCVVVKTSEKRETRYKVPMTLRWNDFEKEVVVTLNNRGHMNFPLLLGRNFLEDDFVVDISLPRK